MIDLLESLFRQGPIVALGTLIYALGILFGLGFTIHYGVTAPWWKSAIGRMFMVIGSALVVAGVVVIMSLLLGPDYPGREFVRLAGYGFFTVATGFLYGTYLHERRNPASSLPIRKRDRMSTLPDLPNLTTADERIVTVSEDVIREPSIGSDGIGVAGLSVVTVNSGVPTQIANPSRASWRTFTQSAIAFLVVANAAAVVLVSFLATPDGQEILALLPPSFVGVLFAILNAVVLVGSGVAKLAALLMSNPTVNEWISKHAAFLAPIRPTPEVEQ